MRIKWRGLELPSRITPDPRFRGPTYGRFTIEPFEQGFGTTIGNSLRRILLSAIEGAALTSLKIKGVQHEFSTVPGMLEDVTDVVLNVKSVVVKLEGDEAKTLKLAARGPGEVTADIIEADPAVTIVSKDLVLATLTDKIDLEMEMRVEKGRGYVSATERLSQQTEDQEIGVIPLDALFSPVQRVRYAIEQTRVGQKTNYDKLVMEIWTNGTITPENALVEAAKIMRKHLNAFTQYFELGAERVSSEAAAAASVDEELVRKLLMPIGDMDLSVRASNCLESAKIQTVADLVSRTDADLLKVRSFGRTSLREVKKKLQDMGLDLGMTLPDGVTTSGPSAAPAGNPA